MEDDGEVVYVSHGVNRRDSTNYMVWLVAVKAHDTTPRPFGPVPPSGSPQPWGVTDYVIALVGDRNGEVVAALFTDRQVPTPSQPPLTQSDLFWNPVTEQAPLFFYDNGFQSLVDMVQKSDLVIRGRVTDVYIGEIWHGAADDPGEPLTYIRITIDDLLKGKPVSRKPGSVEVQFQLAGPDAPAPDPTFLPGDESLFFLIHDASYIQANGGKPRNSDIAPFAYFHQSPETVIRNTAGLAHLIEPELIEDAYGRDYPALALEGMDFEALVAQVRGMANQ
jgi:hypothetical protein